MFQEGRLTLIPPRASPSQTMKPSCRDLFMKKIVPQSIGRVHADGVASISIHEDAQRALTSLAHRRDDRSAAVQNFVAVARRLAPAAMAPLSAAAD
jgi:hypothetical protein